VGAGGHEDVGISFESSFYEFRIFFIFMSIGTF